MIKMASISKWLFKTLALRINTSGTSGKVSSLGDKTMKMILLTLVSFILIGGCAHIELGRYCR